MLTEGFVSIMALIAACTLLPGDYFAINTPVDAYAGFVEANPQYAEQELGYFAEHIGLELHGRTGGVVSLAVGMANIFSSIPFMDNP